MAIKPSWILLLLSLILTPILASFSPTQPLTPRDNSLPLNTPLKNVQCKLNKIIDGDSIKAFCPTISKQSLSIRIWGIDAPEMGQQPWGKSSKKTLIKLINNSPFTLNIYEKDRYERFIAKIFRNNQDIGLEMVKKGQAIVYHRYNREIDYKNAEKKAKIDRIGIWKKSGAQQHPEKWRRLNPFINK